MRIQSAPLLEWIARIGHPEAKGLVAFDYAVECEIQRKVNASGEEKALRQREKGRGRVRRCREWKGGKWVYPGDWLRFRTDEKPPPKWGFPATPKCDVCGETSTEGHWWLHRLRQVVRCRDCQEKEWWTDGYEIDEFGMPSCFNHKHTREERIAERTRNQLHEAAEYRARLEGVECDTMYQALLAREPEQTRQLIEQLEQKERAGYLDT